MTEKGGGGGGGADVLELDSLCERTRDEENGMRAAGRAAQRATRGRIVLEASMILSCRQLSVKDAPSIVVVVLTRTFVGDGDWMPWNGSS